MCHNISFIIYTHNNVETIGRCIESIALEAKRYWGLEYEIVILDNNSTDGTAQEAIKYNKLAPIRTRFLQSGSAIHRKFNLHAHIDATCTIPPDWVGFITHSFLNPQVNIVSGPILDTSWTPLQHLYFMIKWYWFKWWDPMPNVGNMVVRANHANFNNGILVLDERARVHLQPTVKTGHPN